MTPPLLKTFLMATWLVVSASVLRADGLSVVTSPATGVTDVAATLNGTINPGGGSFWVYFEYGTTAAYGRAIEASSPTISGSTVQGRSAQPAGLLPSTTYHYRVLLANFQTTPTTYIYGDDVTFTTAAPATAPTPGPVGLDYAGVHNVTVYDADLASGSSPATVSIEYGLTTAYGMTVTSQTQVPTNSTESPSLTLTGLAPGTLYHYRCKATNAEGTGYSADGTFTTRSAPTLSTTAATNVADMTASLHGTANSNGSVYLLSFELGTTTDYGTAPGSNPGSIGFGEVVAPSGTASGLFPNTTYHYRLKATTADIWGDVFYGNDMTFTTGAPATPPTVGSAFAQGIEATEAYLSVFGVQAGSSPTTVSFEYGLTNAYGSTVIYDTVIPTNTSSSGSPAVFVNGLIPSSTYHFRCKATNGQGSTYSEDATFTTPAGPSLVATAPTGVTDIAAVFNGSINTDGQPMVITFEYGPTTSYGSSIYPSPISWQNSSGAPVSVVPGRLLAGTTYHYRIKGVNQNNSHVAYGNDMTFTTQAPSTKAEVGTLTFTSGGPTFASLYGSVTWSGSSEADVYVEYGTTTAYGTSVLYDHVPANTSLGFGQTISGLQPLTDYHARVRVTNAEGTSYSNDLSFTTSGIPVATTGVATNVTDLSAGLSGSINPNGPSTTATVVFEIGTTTDYGNTVNATPGSILSSALTTFTGTATGLLPGTTYHYRSKVTYGFTSSVFYGPDVTFTTAPAATPPTIGTVTTGAINPTTAAVHASVVSAGSSNATVTWEYGTTTSYNFTQTSSPATVAVSTSSATSASLGGLAPSTTYHYRCVAVNAEGTAVSADRTFTTLAGPSVTTNPATGITDLTAVLNGTANANGGSYVIDFELGTTTDYGTALFVLGNTISGSSDTQFAPSASGLLPNTTYHFRLRARDSNFVYCYGADQSFTTGPPNTPPTVVTGSASNLAPIAVTLQASSLAAGSSPATLVFEYGTTTSYGSQVTYATPLPTSTFSAPLCQITGLTPNTTYHFRAKATNNEGSSTGGDATFTTLALPTVTTDPVTNLGASTTTLNGTYNKQGATYTVTFDYGTTTAYGSTAIPGGGLVIIGGGGGLIIGGGLGGIIIIGGGGPDFSTHTTSATAVGLVAQTTYHYRLKLTDSYGNSYYGADSSFTTVTPVQAWRLAKFGDVSNSGNGDDNFCPAGDGIPNLMKYALGLDPALPGTVPQPELKDYNGAKYLSLTFQRDPAKKDLTYEVQAADSPAGPWTTVASSVGGAASTGPGLVSETQPGIFFGGSPPPVTVEVRDVASMEDAPRRFLRLKVTR